MNRNESPGPTLLWLVTWYLLSKHMDGTVAFVVALAYFAIGWLAIRLCSRTVFRQGAHGWFLILQIGGWFVLFFLFAPIAGDAAFLLLWGIGLPLLFLGGLARAAYDRFPRFRDEVVPVVAKPYTLALLLVPPVGAWWEGHGFWRPLAVTLVAAVLSAILIGYGWMLAEAPARGERDARFGSDEDYRAAGMSDER
jgi:hypothetical protein